MKILRLAPFLAFLILSSRLAAQNVPQIVQYQAAKAIAQGQLLAEDTSNNVFAISAGSTSGVIGVAQTSGVAGQTINVVISGSTLIDVDNTCAVGNFIAISSSLNGIGDCQSSAPTGQVVAMAEPRPGRTTGLVQALISPAASSPGGGTGSGSGILSALGTGSAQTQTILAGNFISGTCPQSYTDGMLITWKPVAANNAPAPTLQVCTLSALTIVKGGNNSVAVALIANDIAGTGVDAVGQYSATLGELVLLNPQAQLVAGTNIAWGSAPPVCSGSGILCLGESTGQTAPAGTDAIRGDSTDARPHQFGNGVDLGAIGKGGSAATIIASTQNGNTVALASDFTTASTSLVAITGMSWTFGATNQNYSFRCDGSYSQATAAAANTIGIQATTTAPTSLYVQGVAYTSLAGASVNGAIRALASTTATNLVTFTPGAFGAIGTVADMFPFTVYGRLEQGAGATTLQLMALTGSASDSLTFYRGMTCSLLP